MKKLLLVPAALAAFTAAGAGLSGVAAADSPAVTACTTVKAKENVHIRASMGGTSLGLFYKDTTACSLSRHTSATSYTACGVTSKTWYYIDYRGTRGYVAGACVSYV
ncbi:hypothetical protein ACSNOI_01280 [Actinomadura kijaniata]|uniref:hypothetical protein n=1 Tax=Actinomadura kijaniata TaxID=46161 RepID=UPI003F1BDD64